MRNCCLCDFDETFTEDKLCFWHKREYNDWSSDTDNGLYVIRDYKQKKRKPAPTRLSGYETAKRNVEMCRKRRNGMNFKQIGKEYNLSGASVGNIITCCVKNKKGGCYNEKHMEIVMKRYEECTCEGKTLSAGTHTRWFWHKEGCPLREKLKK